MLSDGGGAGLEITVRSIATRAAVRPVKATAAPRKALGVTAKLLCAEAFGSSRFFLCRCSLEADAECCEREASCHI
eukprot:2590691-Pyramimonas_sp.AAC.1